MQNRYIKQLNMSLSPLGFGVMRLTMNPNGSFPVEVHNLIDSAYEQGINYFDTAYPYLGGHSEELIRDALVKKYPRDSFYIADKLPVWDCHTIADMERIFNIQLERLGVEYIDFYMLHGLNRFRWADMYEKGVLDFLDTKRREGRIRKVGFSIHDDKQTLETIVNAYDWEFAMLQINYYDWIAQQAKGSYDLLAERDIPCMVMEPVGGGRLAKLPKEAAVLLSEVNPDDSEASWAIRFVAGLSNVVITLSGMSNMEQLNDNLKCFNPFIALDTKELDVLDNVVKILSSKNTLPCSVCAYCLDECPVNVDIPQIFQRYNDYMQFSKAARFDVDYFAFVPDARRADKCIQCGKCNGYCPQNIDIPKELMRLHDLALGLSVGIDIGTLKELIKDANLILFGAGAIGRNTSAVLRSCGVNADYFCDNGISLHGSEIDSMKVIDPATLKEIAQKCNVCILITSSYQVEITAQLESMGLAKYIIRGP